MFLFLASHLADNVFKMLLKRCLNVVRTLLKHLKNV